MMSDSQTHVLSNSPHDGDKTKEDNNSRNSNNLPESEIAVEIISEEEMALIEAALAAARSSASSLSSSSFSRSTYSPLKRTARSIESITALSKRRLPTLSGSSSGHDIEDSGQWKSNQKNSPATESLLTRFRRRKGLYVTDITSTEWCEKQMEFLLLLGKPEITTAMRTGNIRHAKLAEEVVKRVKVSVKSSEDVWALKFMNFIVGANQLLLEGLTRELPLIGFVEGVWMVGVIDELRMPVTGSDKNPILVDTKTRVQAKLPGEPQQRNGRLQLMCYKYLWDNLVANNFPLRKFYDWFCLNPDNILSDEIKKSSADAGFPAETLGEMMRYFINACSVLPAAHDWLLLRYELQEGNFLLGEYQFPYDINWVKTQIQHCLKFWEGERKASYVSEEEQWKCRFCQFAIVCPSQSDLNGDSSSQTI
ncbi:hypothetical protein Nepgr_013089 [Nepenthes gracilis]|uniref:Exonuclease V n=1 Tax=Nepenthes gracilis TaxID=150966 RepID=A0AAD3XNN9_NEPGR|nr:hypothetical protein Nepgr_013089 [Nepenthes gracilis]